MIPRLKMRVLGVAAFCGPAICILSWFIATGRAPGYDPWREDLSALAAMNAAHPWITIAGCLAAAVGMLAAAAGLARELHGRDLVVGAALIVVAGAAMATQALAREDCSTELPGCMARVAAGQVSWHHTAHGIAAVTLFLTLLGAAWVLARAFGQDPRWQGLSPYSLTSAAVGLALLVAYLAVPREIAGATERIFVTVLLTWIAIVGIRLVQNSKTGNAHDGSGR